jgi:hypothetical protein
VEEIFEEGHMPVNLLRAATVGLGVMMAAALASNSVVQAQSSGAMPWGPRAFCTQGGHNSDGVGLPNCYYYTWEQCLETSRGIGESCMANPYFVGKPEAPGSVRKHRRRS